MVGQREEVLSSKYFVDISIKRVVGQAGNLFILAENVGFAFVLSKGSDGESKRS